MHGSQRGTQQQTAGGVQSGRSRENTKVPRDPAVRLHVGPETSEDRTQSRSRTSQSAGHSGDLQDHGGPDPGPRKTNIGPVLRNQRRSGECSTTRVRAPCRLRSGSHCSCFHQKSHLRENQRRTFTFFGFFFFYGFQRFPRTAHRGFLRVPAGARTANNEPSEGCEGRFEGGFLAWVLDVFRRPNPRGGHRPDTWLICGFASEKLVSKRCTELFMSSCVKHVEGETSMWSKGV